MATGVQPPGTSQDPERKPEVGDTIFPRRIFTLALSTESRRLSSISIWSALSVDPAIGLVCCGMIPIMATATAHGMRKLA